MSLKLGTQNVAGISQNTKYNAHHLLDFKWTDCIMNDVSWLRADTFSWQPGDVYISAYNHLVADISGTTAETETIGSYTVTFYRATDGHKICLADQETTVLNIYNESGIAWYYIIDTTNTQFKLPRTKFGFEGLRTNVGDKIKAGLPDVSFTVPTTDVHHTVTGGPSYIYTGSSKSTFSLSTANPIYGNSNTVQEQATQMYLYFYVGDYSQTAIEQTAGLNSELFNGKADVNLSNVPSSKGILVESYGNSTSWYRVYSDGWCVQGGHFMATVTGNNTISLLKPYADNSYSVSFSRYSGYGGSINTASYWVNMITGITANNFSVAIDTGYANPIIWQACGYIN